MSKKSESGKAEVKDVSAEEAAAAAPAEESPEAAAPEQAGEAEPDPRDVALAELTDQVDALKQENSANMARLRAVSKAYQDLQKEMEAFRARTQSQLTVKLEVQKFQVVQTFFEPVQNLKRAIGADSSDTEGYQKGIQMTLDQFSEGLERLGLAPVPGEGAVFDPKMHEALGIMPVTDPSLDGKVQVVHVDGYKVGDKVLKAAQVVIGKYTPEEPPSADEPADDGSDTSADS